MSHALRPIHGAFSTKRASAIDDFSSLTTTRGAEESTQVTKMQAVLYALADYWSLAAQWWRCAVFHRGMALRIGSDVDRERTEESVELTIMS